LFLTSSQYLPAPSASCWSCLSPSAKPCQNKKFKWFYYLVETKFYGYRITKNTTGTIDGIFYQKLQWIYFFRAVPVPVPNASWRWSDTNLVKIFGSGKCSNENVRIVLDQNLDS
jgi:hypothetical protein